MSDSCSVTFTVWICYWNVSSASHAFSHSHGYLEQTQGKEKLCSSCLSECVLHRLTRTHSPCWTGNSDTGKIAPKGTTCWSRRTAFLLFLFFWQFSRIGENRQLIHRFFFFFLEACFFQAYANSVFRQLVNIFTIVLSFCKILLQFTNFWWW